MTHFSLARIIFVFVVFVAFKCETVLGAQPNLILNSNIEAGSSSPTSWSTLMYSGDMSPSWTTVEAVSDSHSLCTVVSAPGTGDWRQLITGINPDTHYRFRIHIRASNITSGSHSAELQWFSDSNTYLGRHLFSATSANQWQELKDNDITPPANASKVYVLLRTYQIGTYYFDDPVLMRKDNNLHTIEGKFPIGLYGRPTNQFLINGNTDSHAENSTNAPLIWKTCTGTGSPDFSWDTSLAYSGTHSLKIALPGNSNVDWRQLVTNIDENDSFNLKAKIYTDNIESGSHAVELHWFDASSTYLGRNMFSSDTANEWVTIDETNIVPPSGAVKVYFLLRAYKEGNYNFDDLSFLREQTSTQKITELKDAGFNLYFAYSTDLGIMDTIGDIYGVRSVDMEDLNAAANTVNIYEDKPALRIWHGNDEPAWHTPAIPSDDLVDGYDTIIEEDDYLTSAPHLIWLNHAPRGTSEYPSDFSLLRAYSEAADIISMDIYPVGSDYHSSLPDKTPSSVGAYTQILYDEVCTDATGLQDKIIWMVLQGFGWTDLNQRSTHGVEIHWLQGGSLLRRDIFYTSKISAWELVTASNLIPPTGATSAVILLRAYSKGDYNFDDVVFMEEGTNLLSNSNFETQDGASGYPANWTRIVSTGTATQTWDTSTYASSTHSVKSSVTYSGNIEWRQEVDVDDSKAYSLSAYLKSSIGSELPRPDWTQTRFMAYDAIINGARGLFYWGTILIGANTELWSDVKQIAGEINELSDELTCPSSFRAVSVNSSAIEYLLLDTEDGLCLIAANKTASSVNNVTFQISGLDLSQIEEYYAASPEAISNNSFTESFSAYEVKIWQIQ